MAWKFELVAGPLGYTSEGPAWDGRHLYFSLIQDKKIMRYDPKSGECIEWKNNTKGVNGMLFGADGRLYGCQATGRAMVRIEADGSMTTLVDRIDGKRLNTPNDLAIDMKGRIWFSNPWNTGLVAPGDSKELADESVLRADPGPDGKYTVTRVATDLTSPNGVLLSVDEKVLYVAECDYGEDRLRELRGYPINADGSLGKHSVLHQFGKDHRGVHRSVDGMCLDSEGNIIACAGWSKSGPGPLIYVFAPSGRVIETHAIPADHPANCTFGDADLSTLYVTTRAGHLWRARTERRGHMLYPLYAAGKH